MDIKMLQGLSERTLKSMVIDLYSQNDKLKKQIKDCEKPLLHTIENLNREKMSLEVDIKLSYKILNRVGAILVLPSSANILSAGSQFCSNH